MTHKGDEGRLLHVDSLARVEGEGALHVRVHAGDGEEYGS